MLNDILKKLRWLGHDGFLLQAMDKNIYIDPYKIPADMPEADLILITHEHYDHCSPEDVEKILKRDTVIVTEKKSAKKFKDRCDVIILEPGQDAEIDGIGITAVPAYNIDKKFHPKKNKWLGFIITIDDVLVYHAGDTDLIPEMEDIKTDIALLPVGGTYTMTAAEAARAALEIEPAVAIPMHFGSSVGTEDDARQFAEALKGKIRVEIL